MSSQPRLRLDPEVLYPPMPDHVRKEIVDLLVEALVKDLQENQEEKSIIVVSRSGNHNTTEGADNH
jgi:hypothetical protein